MKKIIALFTAVMFALTLGVAFAQEKMAAPMPEKKAEEKAPAKKEKKSHKEKKKAKKEKKAEKKEEAPMAPAAK